MKQSPTHGTLTLPLHTMTWTWIALMSCRANEESEKLSQEDCYQLLIQAQEMLRKEYIQKQNKAREEIEKR